MAGYAFYRLAVADVPAAERVIARSCVHCDRLGVDWPMACPHCATEENLLASGWCRDCERAFGIWGRRYATDIVSTVLVGMVIVLVGGLGLPLLGLGWLASASSIFVSFGAMIALYQFHDRRRRRQFLESRLPRAYLPTRT